MVGDGERADLSARLESATVALNKAIDIGTLNDTRAIIYHQATMRYRRAIRSALAILATGRPQTAARKLQFELEMTERWLKDKLK